MKYANALIFKAVRFQSGIHDTAGFSPRHAKRIPITPASIPSSLFHPLIEVNSPLQHTSILRSFTILRTAEAQHHAASHLPRSYIKGHPFPFTRLPVHASFLHPVFARAVAQSEDEAQFMQGVAGSRYAGTGLKGSTICRNRIVISEDCCIGKVIVSEVWECDVTSTHRVSVM
jgi:hypothetical protein